MQELLEQSKKADWDSAAPCADAGEIANTPGEEALDLNSKGSMDSKREKGKWSGGGGHGGRGSDAGYVLGQTCRQGVQVFTTVHGRRSRVLAQGVVVMGL